VHHAPFADCRRLRFPGTPHVLSRAVAVAVATFATLTAGATQAADLAISIIAAHSHDAGSATPHLSGDAMPLGTRYQIVVSPASDAPLSVSAGDNSNFYRTSRVSASRPLRLPHSGGWYTAPSKAGDVRIVATQDGVSVEHIIRAVDVRTLGAGDRNAAPIALAEPHSVEGIEPRDFTALLKDVSAFRAVAAQLGNAPLQAPVSGTGADVFKRAAPSVVLIRRDDGSGGSGIVVKSGEILTNWHVARGAKSLGVILFRASEPSVPGNTRYEAKVLKYDEVADLALLSFSGPPTPTLELGDEKALAIGSRVHAIGHPLWQFWSYTQGVVSQIRPDFPWQTSGETIQHKATLIQTQTPIAPGNSGGPLMTDDAKLVGVNSWIRLERDGYNYAVAVSEVKRFLAMSGNRTAPTSPTDKIAAVSQVKSPPPQVKPAAAEAVAQSCTPQPIKAYLDKTSNKKVTLVDTRCTGRANLIHVGGPAGRHPEYALIDTTGDSRIDIKIVYGFQPNVNLWIFYGKRDGVPTAFGYERDNAGRPERIVAINMSRR
jgi:S1-C subfamily serine protease